MGVTVPARRHQERLARMKALVLGRISSPIASPIRTPAVAATDNGRLALVQAGGIARVKSAKSIGVRSGNWLSLRQAQAPLNAPDITTTKLRGFVQA
jgi:hypothetical protein